MRGGPTSMFSATATAPTAVNPGKKTMDHDQSLHYRRRHQKSMSLLDEMTSLGTPGSGEGVDGDVSGGLPPLHSHAHHASIATGLSGISIRVYDDQNQQREDKDEDEDEEGSQRPESLSSASSSDPSSPSAPPSDEASHTVAGDNTYSSSKRTSIIYSTTRSFTSPSATPHDSPTASFASKSSAGEMVTLPLTFQDELPGMENETLPVRLGLVPPYDMLGSGKPAHILCAPPPPPSPHQRRQAGNDGQAATGPIPSSRRQKESFFQEEGGAKDLSYYMINPPSSSSSAQQQARNHTRGGSTFASTSAFTLDTFTSAPSSRRPSHTPSTSSSNFSFGGSGAGSGLVGTVSGAASSSLLGMENGDYADDGLLFSHGAGGDAGRRNGSHHRHGASEDWSSMDTDRQWHPSDYFRYETVYARGRKRVRKWHGYPARKAPYYYSYDPEVTQADEILHGVTVAALQRPTVHPFPPGQQPARVLDVGCGVGHWTLETALQWPQTEFIGMDLVPIQTPVSALDNEDLDHRVHWVVANFLEEWPFPDASFDFVHLRYIESGVPEMMWDHVLSEAVRVIAPGGVIEVVAAAVPFLGNASVIPQSDLLAMAQGKNSASSMNNHHNLLGQSASVDPADPFRVPHKPSYDALKVVFAKMDNRRFINPKPNSVIPGAMLPLDLSHRKQTLIRRFPMRADPLSHIPGGLDDTGTDTRYTAGVQNVMAQNLASMDLKLDGKEIMRALIIWTSATLRSASRQLVWAEADREKKEEVIRRLSDPAAEKKQPKDQYTMADLEANRPFIHPWSSKLDFDVAMDEWKQDLIQRAGVGLLCTNLLGWRHGSIELNKETRKKVERQRKMSVSTARSVPIGSPVLSRQLDPTMANAFRIRGRATSDGFHAPRSVSTPTSPVPPASPQPDTDIQSQAALEEYVSVLGYREVGVFSARKKLA